MCLPVREEVWLKRISHSVGFYPMQPDGCFRLSSLCWVEGALTESCPFLEAGGSRRVGWLSVPALPSWGTRRALGHSVWVENTHTFTQLASESLCLRSGIDKLWGGQRDPALLQSGSRVWDGLCQLPKQPWEFVSRSQGSKGLKLT